MKKINDSQRTTINGQAGDVVISSTNLIQRTSPDWLTGSYRWNKPMADGYATVMTTLHNSPVIALSDLGLEPGDIITIAGEINYVSYAGPERNRTSFLAYYADASIVDLDSEVYSAVMREDSAYVGETKTLVTVLRIPDRAVYICPALVFSYADSVVSLSSTVRYRRIRMTRGNVVSDWSLSPAEILTRLAALEAKNGITYEPPSYDGPEIMDNPLNGVQQTESEM